MNTIGGFDFPETESECNAWVPTTRHVALGTNVLAVMRTRIEGTWRAYCGAVRGNDHSREMHLVVDSGTALPERLARATFGVSDELPYAS